MTVQRLREQQATVKSQLAEASAQLLPAHPRIVALKQVLADLDRQIRAEALKIVDSLEQQARIAAARESSLRGSLGTLKVRASTSKIDEVRLRALEREAAANRTLLEGFLHRYSDASSRQDLLAQPPLARIISRAEAPLEPSFPQRLPILALGGFGGLMMALLAAFLAEVFSAHRLVEAPATSGGWPGPPAPGHAAPVPAHMALRGADFAPLGGGMRPDPSATAALGGPDPSWQRLAETLIEARGATGLRRLATIGCPGHAAETARLAAGLAGALASRGFATVVVDADFRNPGLAGRLGLPAGPGLAELLAGRASFLQVIARDGASGAQVLGSGLDCAALRALPASERMDSLLAALERVHDFVLVHAGSSEDVVAIPTAAKAEMALIVVPQGRTDLARPVAARLRSAGLGEAQVVETQQAAGVPADRPAARRAASA